MLSFKLYFNLTWQENLKEVLFVKKPHILHLPSHNATMCQIISKKVSNSMSELDLYNCVKLRKLNVQLLNSNQTNVAAWFPVSTQLRLFEGTGRHRSNLLTPGQKPAKLLKLLNPYL